MRDGRAEAAGATTAEVDEETVERPDDARDLVDFVLEAHEARAREATQALRIDGVLVGTLVALEGPTSARVTFPGAPTEGVLARPFASLATEDVGAQVALMFEGADPARPIVMGKMSAHGAPQPTTSVAVTNDGERIELRADKEITLACGDASITLTRAGKVLIKGSYVLVRSSGVHRIQGGSVEIN